MSARFWRGVLLLVVGLALQLLGGGCAWTGLGEPDPRDQLERNEAMPRFWHASGSTGADLYLLGSIHLGPVNGWRYPLQIDEAFARSSALVVELDPRNVTPLVQQALVARYGMLTPSESLSDYLSTETLALLDQHLAKSRLPRAAILRMQPWMVGNMLVVEAGQRAGYTPRGGVDQGFLDRSGERSIVPLETAEYQMALMAGLSREVQELALLDTLNRFDSIEDYLTTMVRAWQVGDDKALEKLLFESQGDREGLEPFLEQLIYRRNHEMSARLAVLLRAEQHAGESVFVVIGAGHLIGKRGVRKLLESEGFKIEEVELDSPRRIELAGDDRAIHP
jgi:uncharacterized protein YbaP (TraB family)